jgi:hypothetical protein
VLTLWLSAFGKGSAGLGAGGSGFCMGSGGGGMDSDASASLAVGAAAIGSSGGGSSGAPREVDLNLFLSCFSEEMRPSLRYLLCARAYSLFVC